MLELGSDCFDAICGDPAVRAELATLEESRQAAVRRFWTFFAAGIALGALAFFLLGRSDRAQFGWLAALLCVGAGLGLGMHALSKVGEALKQPVLAALAAKAGLEYMEKGFSPPVYPEARDTLFGHWLSQETFTDLFHGKDGEGKNHAVYEADLERRSGKNSRTIFRGQIYAVERKAPAGGTTAIVPDRGLFNFFKPAAGMTRVSLESDPEFEKKFEIYSTSEMEARQLLFDSAFRARLLSLAAGGRTFVFVAPDNALVAATSPDRFEPGSMLRSVSGEERVRKMVNDVCAAIAILREVKAGLG
jgi:hypothetical protein